MLYAVLQKARTDATHHLAAFGASSDLILYAVLQEAITAAVPILQLLGHHQF